MSNTEHPAGAAHRSFRCTFGPVREVDLVWPPPDADIDAFTVVHLDDGDAQPPRVEPPPHRASARRASAARGRRPRASPHQAHVRRLSSSAAPRLACARWSCRWSRRPCLDRPCPTCRWSGHRPRSLKKRWLRTRRPTTSDRRCRGSAARRFIPRHAAPGSRDSRRPSIGVAGGVLRGGVRAGDVRRVSRRSPGDRTRPRRRQCRRELSVADVPAPQVHRRAGRPRRRTPATAERTVAASPARPIPAPTPKLARAPRGRAPEPTPVAAPASGPRLPVVTPRREVEPASVRSRRT